MPELPEVELATRSLRAWLEGGRVDHVSVLDPKLLQGREEDAWDTQLAGRTCRGVNRRAKYLVMTFDGDLAMLAHLRMTGRFRFDPGDGGGLTLPDRLALRREGGGVVIFRDPRRFGQIRVGTLDELATWPELAVLGPDALLEPVSAPRLAEIASGRKASIKALLMDQRRIGGLGNICASEILYRAGIAPWRPAGQIRQEELERLSSIIPEYLRWAIDAQSERELIYLGERGATNPFTVYRREGSPCARCGATIARVTIAGRGSYYCPGCQQ